MMHTFNTFKKLAFIKANYALGVIITNMQILSSLCKSW